MLIPGCCGLIRHKAISTSRYETSHLLNDSLEYGLCNVHSIWTSEGWTGNLRSDCVSRVNVLCCSKTWLHCRVTQNNFIFLNNKNYILRNVFSIAKPFLVILFGNFVIRFDIILCILLLVVTINVSWKCLI